MDGPSGENDQIYVCGRCKMYADREMRTHDVSVIVCNKRSSGTRHARDRCRLKGHMKTIAAWKNKQIGVILT